MTGSEKIVYNHAYYKRCRPQIRKQQAGYAVRCAPAIKARQKERGADWHRKRAYGISPAQFAALRVVQKNQCAICEKLFTDSNLPHVDHNHGTGEVRGLLCRKCNTGIGMLRDSARLLRRAYHYIGESDGVLNQFRLALEVDRSYARWLAIHGN